MLKVVVKQFRLGFISLFIPPLLSVVRTMSRTGIIGLLRLKDDDDDDDNVQTLINWSWTSMHFQQIGPRKISQLGI